jgi:hypothetical protein
LSAAAVIIRFALFTKWNCWRKKGPSQNAGRAFLGRRWKDVFAMADKRALKLIGIMFAALTLMVISTAAVVVAGHAASSADGEYLKLVDLRD